VELGPRETRAVESFRLILPGGEAPEPARLNLVSSDLRERYEVALCVVPWQGAAREAELAGVWRAVSLQHRSGSTVADAGAAGGKAWASPAPEGEGVHIVFGPYAELVKGKYLAAFRLRLGEAQDQPTRDTPVATLEVFSGGYQGLGKVLASREVRVSDLPGDGSYAWLVVPADWPGPPGLMETRVLWHGRAQVGRGQRGSVRAAMRPVVGRAPARRRAGKRRGARAAARRGKCPESRRKALRRVQRRQGRRLLRAKGIKKAGREEGCLRKGAFATSAG
ncbi:MAG: hypothetical protein J7M26_08555, partial [Armatimonadetes bacterium]|nr:hypothetical protein [Armatimonadota bacterium]